MKIKLIDNGPRTQETTDAGLKVKSHVKAGLAYATFNNPTLQPVALGVVRPIAICG